MRSPSNFTFNRHEGRPKDQILLKNIPLGIARLVENTGFEPVTSWLQTRRSPS
jgi:hypothetical protein